jgi:hypothetical protein
MQQMFNQLLRLLQQGIAAIFRFVQLIWSWSTGQIVKVFAAPVAFQININGFALLRAGRPGVIAGPL